MSTATVVTGIAKKAVGESRRRVVSAEIIGVNEVFVMVRIPRLYKGGRFYHGFWEIHLLSDIVQDTVKALWPGSRILCYVEVTITPPFLVLSGFSDWRLS